MTEISNVLPKNFLLQDFFLVSNEEIYLPLSMAGSESKDRTNVRRLSIKMTLLFAWSEACGPDFY